MRSTAVTSILFSFTALLRDPLVVKATRWLLDAVLLWDKCHLTNADHLGL